MPSPAATRFFLSKSQEKLNFHSISSPEEDKFLSMQFGYRSLGKRKENKRQVLQEHGRTLLEEAKKPLLVLFVDLFTTVKERFLLEELLQGLSELDVHILVLANKKTCSAELLQRCLQADTTEKNFHVALAAADVVILPSSANNALVRSCMDYGTIPVVSVKAEGVVDYDPTRETGNSFVYKWSSAWSIFASTVRALETFKLSYDWQRIQRNGMEG